MNAGTAANKAQQSLELPALSVSVIILGSIRGRFSDHRRSSAMKREGALPFESRRSHSAELIDRRGGEGLDRRSVPGRRASRLLLREAMQRTQSPTPIATVPNARCIAGM